MKIYFFIAALLFTQNMLSQTNGYAIEGLYYLCGDSIPDSASLKYLDEFVSINYSVLLADEVEFIFWINNNTCDKDASKIGYKRIYFITNYLRFNYPQFTDHIIVVIDSDKVNPNSPPFTRNEKYLGLIYKTIESLNTSE